MILAAASIRNKGRIVYNKHEWTDLTDFIDSNIFPNAFAEIQDGKIKFAGGSGDQQNELSIPLLTVSEKFKMTLYYSAPTNTDAASVGIRSAGNNYHAHASARYVAVTAGGIFEGHSILYASNNDNIYDVVATSDIVIPITDSNFYKLEFVRDGEFTKVKTTALTTGATNYAIHKYLINVMPSPNTGRFSIGNLGGDPVLIYLIRIETFDTYNADLCFFGDSKTSRYNAANFTNRFPNRVAAALSKTFIVLAGPGDIASDMLARIPEAISLKPKKLLMGGVSNSIRAGIPSTTYLPEYDSMITDLLAAGIDVVHTTGFYETSGLDQSVFRSHVIATYPSGKVIDTLPTVVTLDTDAVHPNDTGMQDIATMLVSSGKL